MLMQNNIPRDEYVLCIKVIYTITFLPKRINNKNASTCMHVKFVHGCEVSCIT